MKKLLLATLMAASATTAFAQDITFAMEASYPPFETTNVKGEIVGFDVDIANAICKEIDATCHFKNLPFDALIPGLIRNRGGYQASISAIDITKARAKKVAFSEPYYDSSASFIGLNDVKDLKQVKTVGVQNGTTFQQYIVAQEKGMTPKAYASIQDAILDLRNGRIDALFGDTAVLSDALKKEQDLHFVGQKVTDKAYFGNGLGIAVNKSKKELLEQLNKGINAIKANGQYDEIYKKWMAN